MAHSGFAFPWNLKYSGPFTKSVADTISLCTPSDPRGVLYTSQVPFIKRICSFAAFGAWPDPVEEYGVLSYFGGSVVINILLEMIMQESWEERMGKSRFLMLLTSL